MRHTQSRYHALIDIWHPLCGANSKLPLGVLTQEFDRTSATLDKRATKRNMVACARCCAMLNRGATGEVGN